MKRLQLSIPEPCHENWTQMTLAEKGKFCAACQKNVYDFTKSTDREIIQAYEKDQNLCGRFSNTQLDRDLIIQKKRKSIWFASLFFGFIFLMSGKAIAQGKPRIEQTGNQTNKNEEKVIKQQDSFEEFEISGFVNDESGPIPGANILIKGSQRNAQTNFDGCFTIKVKVGDVLIVSFLGFDDKLVKIKKKKKKTTYKINLKSDIHVLGRLGVKQKEKFKTYS